MPKKAVLVSKPEKVDDEVNKLLNEKLSDTDTSIAMVVAGDTLIATKQLAEYYISNQFTVTWTQKGKLNKAGDTLFHIIRNAGEYGLIPEDYHSDKLKSLFERSYNEKNKKYDAVTLSEADLLLTDGFIKFLVHVSKGRLNADSLTAEWHPEKLDTNLVNVLASALKRNDIRKCFDSFEPENDQYQKLKTALKEYKREFFGITWDSLKSRESDSLTFNQRLKDRLIASHDFSYFYSGNDSIKLLKSVKNFQCKHNLVEDGKIGKLTFKALQQTKEDVIRQIEMNMERWRWKDGPPEKTYVWVNIPKFEMHVMEQDTLVMRSRVIVGAPKTTTPLLKSTIRYFIIYPYWTVPFSIITKEILPQLKRDTSYLRRKNFEVLDRNGYVIDTMINWKRYSKNYFPFKIRQRIGEDNSLGILKFNFNNKYGVYMHDTDNRRLFGRENRALSHGCVRLEKFYDFAKFLIRDDSVRYPVDSLNVDLSKEEQKQINLRKPIPIYINYFTVEVDEYMEIHYFNDIYGRDEKMLRALLKKK
ncbi:MAG: ErfK/YbiS/YcfS/YnhG family protein [Bacteroidota bacterium]|jgi:murein L,D-transpeptidase YcbB/YkuD|nr:ErfK/YbiS/YcfS/YnhG family protein [Bacteroidota bacterium]